MSKRINIQVSATSFFGLILFLGMSILLLMALMLGVSAYQRIQLNRDLNDELRMGTSFLANTLHLSDSASAVRCSEGPEGAALVLAEDAESGNFETRIYLYQGELLLEYALSGTAYESERATKIVSTQQFSFEYDQASGLVALYTDTGCSQICLHSENTAKGAD